MRGAARAHFRAAEAYLAPPPARLIAIGGRSGSGKSTLGRALGPRLGAAPGALHLRSDVIRKVMHGAEDETRLPPSAYAHEVSAAVYERLSALAEAALGAGHAVVVDAVFDRPEDRSAIAAVAAARGVGFNGLWLELPAAVMRARLGARRGDASDATVEVLERQLAHDPGPLAWTVIPAEGTPAEVAALAAAALGLPAAEPAPEPDLRL